MFRRPAATPEQECHKAPAALGTQVAVYEDSIGQLILQWLRKPTYWSEGSSGTQALCVLLQCLFDRFGSVFPQCGLMVFPGVVIVSR